MSSKGNKKAKEALIRLYGAECFIEKLHLRQDSKPRVYSRKKTNGKNEATYIPPHKRKAKWWSSNSRKWSIIKL